MKEDKNTEEMLPEYDFSNGARGEYANRYASGNNVRVLSPEVAAAFPDTQSVNDALKALLVIARQSVAPIK